MKANKKYLIPFNSIVDLEMSVKKMAEQQKRLDELSAENFKKLGIPYRKLGPYGYYINMDEVPNGVNIDEAANLKSTTRDKLFEELGIQLNKDYENRD